VAAASDLQLFLAQGGTLTLREFVFGMRENPTLPKEISLDDLWKFARQFDGDGDGTIDANEYRDYIDNLKPIQEPKHTHFTCSFPDTFCLSDGQLTNWFSLGHDKTFTSRGLPDKPWEGMAAVMKANWRRLPPQAQHTKRGNVANFAVQWITERNAHGEPEFRANVLTYKAFMDLRQQPSAALKSTVAIQVVVIIAGVAGAE
jgi:hypothetical protein